MFGFELEINVAIIEISLAEALELQELGIITVKQGQLSEESFHQQN